jgi:hypothetical protein
LLGRTTGRTVPDMFTRHRTTPDRDLAATTDAFHERLTGTMVSRRTDPPRVDPMELRQRLGGAASAGLRDRLDRRLRPA